jgi:5'-methylthioadenosine phosphorylase
MAKIGVIAGSGLYEIPGLIINKHKTISTPFGKPSDKYIFGEFGNTEVIFLPRHGSRHNLPPHMINYRANIWGFKKLGVERILSISAVGGIKKGLKPGNIVVLNQLIDMTKTRKQTFYDGETGVIHIDFTEPYCAETRRLMLHAGRRSRVPLIDKGTYLAVDGPRLETASEIKAFRMLGGDVVGMTGIPEAPLARELEICYAGISVVANFAAGMSRRKLTTTEVMDAMRTSTEKLKRLLKAAFTLLPEKRKCACKYSLKDAKI